MPPPQTKPSRPPSRSRFQEGSMNDRTSAAPPFQFLEPRELESIAKPAVVSSIRPVPAEHQQDDEDVGRYSSLETMEDKPRGAKGERRVIHKKSSRFLGQVWSGVSRKLGWRKDASAVSDNPVPQQPRRSTDLPARSRDSGTSHLGDRPVSKDEILSSYHDLVASGFFTSHAIPSARHAPPPGRVPSRPGTSMSTAAGVSWPLPPNNDTHLNEHEQPSTTVKVTRRGTKRSAVDEEDVAMPGDRSRSSIESAKRALALPSPKKLRKSPSSLSRSSLERGRAQLPPPQQQQQQQQHLDSAPKLKASTSRRNLLGLRSSSSAATATNGRLTTARGSRPPPVSMTTRMNTGIVIPERGSSARRTVSFGSSDRVLRSHRHSNNSLSSSSAAYPSSSKRGDSGARGNARVATRGIDEVLQVVPDANRGIPNVPRIPEKFTFGEDRENEGPWRGLKVMPAKRVEQQLQEQVDDESECEMF